MPFVSSIQGWVNQPSIFELENLISNQEALVKQATSNKHSYPQTEDALYMKDQRKRSSFSKHSASNKNQEQSKGFSRTCFTGAGSRETSSGIAG